MAIYKRGEFDSGVTEDKSNQWPERDFEPGSTAFKSDAQTTEPRRLLFLVKQNFRTFPESHLQKSKFQIKDKQSCHLKK